MAFDWGEKLLETVLGGVPMVAKLVPEHWRKSAVARLQDVNPFATIPANEDLLRALRLAWIEVAVQIDVSVVHAATATNEQDQSQKPLASPDCCAPPCIACATSPSSATSTRAKRP